MSLRSIFLAGKDAYQATQQLDGMTRGERAGIIAAPAMAAVADRYWQAVGEWLLDTGGQADRDQQNFDGWQEALATAMALPEDEQTGDVVIRCRGHDGGGVNVFDETNTEPVVVRLERLEQEWRERVAQDRGRHEIGANGSPTGRTGWSMTKDGLMYVAKHEPGERPDFPPIVRGLDSMFRARDKVVHPLRPVVAGARAEARDQKRALRRKVNRKISPQRGQRIVIGADGIKRR